MNSQELKNKVFESLDNSVDNGFDPRENSVSEIAEDLINLDSEFENSNAEDLESIVQEWIDTTAS